jgi:type 1 glutamine amidotransferase
MKLLLSMLIVAFAATAATAQSFVKNAEQRAKIEQALPQKALVAPAKPRRLLIFTLNVGYGGHPSMAYANEAFALMGRKTGAFETEVSQNPAVFSRESLKRFDAVFFNNTVGNCFTNADLRQNLLEFITGGGGLLGVHGSSVAFTVWPGAIEDWPEFGYLIGARGANHKDSDEHIWMKAEDPGNPITRVFGPGGFDYRDEFFRPQGTYSRERVRVLLSIDTSKCDPNNGQARGNCYRADNDYAVAWIRNYGRGRVFYCTIAHNPYVFWDAKMLQFYLGALQFALGDLKCPTTPSARLTPAAKVQEQLGWKLALQAGKGATFADDIQAAAALGLAYVGASSSQQAGPANAKSFDPRLTDSELTEIRLQLETAGVRLVSYRTREIPPDEPALRALFEFGRKMGIETFISQHEPKAAADLAKFCNEYGINFALPAKSSFPSSPAGDRIGACLTSSDWLTARRKRKDKLLVSELVSDPALTANVHGFVAEICRLHLAPIFLVEPPSARETTDLFNASCMKLAKRPL